MNSSNNNAGPLAALLADKGSGSKPIISVQSVVHALRKWLVITIPAGIILAAATGTAVWLSFEPVYRATSWLRLRSYKDVALERGSSDDPRSFVQNQIEFMKSPPLLAPVLQDPVVASAPELARSRDQVSVLARMLKVSPRGGSEYFLVEVESANRTASAAIVNKVVDQYLIQFTDYEKTRAERNIALLKEQQDRKEVEIKAVRTIIRELEKNVAGKTPLQSQQASTINYSPLADIKSKLITADVDHAILQAEIGALEEFQKNRKIDVPVSKVQEFVDRHPEVVALRGKITALNEEIAGHVAATKDLSKNASYKKAKETLKRDEVALQELRESVSQKAREQVEAEIRNREEQALEQLKNRLAISEMTSASLKDKFQGEVKTIVEAKGESLNLEFKRLEHDHLFEVNNHIGRKLESIKFDQDVPAPVYRVQAAETPLDPVEKWPLKKLLLYCSAAFLAPFVLAVGWEHLIRRINDRKQLEQVSNLTVVGEISTLPSSARGTRPHTKGRMVRLFEESIDSLRTNIRLSEAMRSVSVLAICSASSREGKTSVASQLALSIARATGKPTLLIDGDMRSPDVHRVFGTPQTPGLAEALAGTCDLEDAIDRTWSNSLHLLPAGVLTSSPHKLLNNGNFGSMLDRLRKTYAFIIIDTPPILPASEALILGKLADAAVLCAMRDVSRVSQVSDAYGRLVFSGVKVAGAVLSGVPYAQYAYKYGNYDYEFAAPDEDTTTPL